MFSFLELNPEVEDDYSPEAAIDVIDSNLILFDPDAWLDRAGKLVPVRTGKKGVELPSQARLRLEEIYRAYVFGNWLSVLALSRSILEYSLLDNLHKFRIDLYWPTTDERRERSKKKLAQLIDEMGELLPHLTEEMHMLRGYGNDYLHPAKTRLSKETLLKREEAASRAIGLLAHVVEELYLYRAK